MSVFNALKLGWVIEIKTLEETINDKIVLMPSSRSSIWILFIMN